MTRPLLVLLFTTFAIYHSVGALQCWSGVRLNVGMSVITYPTTPSLVTCPAESRCCKKEWYDPSSVWYYCCSADCPQDFGGKESITTYTPLPNGRSNSVTSCTGPNEACLWALSIGYGVEQYPTQGWKPIYGPEPPNRCT